MNRKQKLELTWIGKDVRPRLEPRILLEEPEKSYHAKYRVKAGKALTAENAKSTENSGSLRSLRFLRLNDPDDRFDNRLIFGDNFLALPALDQEFFAQKQIKALESQRNTKRRALVDTRDDIDAQRERLIAVIEGKLQQRASLKELCTLRWCLT
jgi:adenine-specific DNA-methyltransferase